MATTFNKGKVFVRAGSGGSVRMEDYNPQTYKTYQKLGRIASPEDYTAFMRRNAAKHIAGKLSGADIQRLSDISGGGGSARDQAMRALISNQEEFAKYSGMLPTGYQFEENIVQDTSGPQTFKYKNKATGEIVNQVAGWSPLQTGQWESLGATTDAVTQPTGTSGPGGTPFTGPRAFDEGGSMYDPTKHVRTEDGQVMIGDEVIGQEQVPQTATVPPGDQFLSSGTPDTNLIIGATNWANLQGQYTPAQLEAATYISGGNRYWNPRVSIENLNPDGTPKSGGGPVAADGLADTTIPMDISGTADGGTTGGTSNTSTAAGESTSSSVQEILNILNAVPETDAQKQEGELSQKISDMLAQTAGESAMLAEQLAKPGGANELTEQLTNTNNEINSLIAQKNAYNTDLEGKPITMSSIIGKQRQVNAVFDAKIFTATARANSLMNNIELARQNAQDAVNAKFGPIFEQIDIYQNQLLALKPLLDKADQERLLVQQVMLDDLRQRQQDARDEEANKQNLAIQIIQNTGDAKLADMVSNAGSYMDAVKLAGQTAMSDGWTYVSTPEQRDQFINQGYELTEVGGRTYARRPQQESVQDLMMKYPDAGINPTDTWQVASGKLSNSRIYQQQTRLAGSGGGGGAGGTGTFTVGNETITETGDTFTDTVNYLVSLRNQGMLNDFNYREQIINLAEITGQDVGTIESMVNQAMSGGQSLPQPEDNNPASDFVTDRTFKEQGLGTLGTDLPTYLESLEETLEPISPLKWAEKAYKGTKKYLTGK